MGKIIFSMLYIIMIISSILLIFLLLAGIVYYVYNLIYADEYKKDNSVKLYKLDNMFKVKFNVLEEPCFIIVRELYKNEDGNYNKIIVRVSKSEYKELSNKRNDFILIEKYIDEYDKIIYRYINDK